jgi:hypothetical protein
MRRNGRDAETGGSMIAIDLPGSEPKSCFSDQSLVGPEHKKGDSADASLQRVGTIFPN